MGKQMIRVIEGKTSGDIDTCRAGHAVPAPRAINLHQMPPGITGPCDDSKFGIREGTRQPVLCSPEIFIDMKFLVHPGEHNRNFGMVPDPSESPFGRSAADRCILPDFFNISGHLPAKVATTEGFHDHDCEPVFGGVFESFCPCLIILIKIIVLDLTELPWVLIHDLFEG
jgi:hypothetical protein